MKNIRLCNSCGRSLIAEIIVFNYRANFYPFFRNDEYYYKEMNVLDTAGEYSIARSLEDTYVFDNGVVKGVLKFNGKEIEIIC